MLTGRDVDDREGRGANRPHPQPHAPLGITKLHLCRAKQKSPGSMFAARAAPV